jgi:hypothetical protein
VRLAESGFRELPGPPLLRYTQESNQCLLPEKDPMRATFILALTLGLGLGFATAALAKPPLEMADEKLPLQELRPLDRRVYVLTLDGEWEKPAKADVTYFVNFLFPDGGSFFHKVDNPEMFARGEVRAIIQNHQLIRHGVSQGGHFTIVVSGGKEVTSATAPEVISNVLDISWPLNRRTTPFRMRSRRSEPAPVDAFPVPGDPNNEPLPPPRPSSKPAPRERNPKPTKTSQGTT